MVVMEEMEGREVNDMEVVVQQWPNRSISKLLSRELSRKTRAKAVDTLDFF